MEASQWLMLFERFTCIQVYTVLDMRSLVPYPVPSLLTVDFILEKILAGNDKLSITLKPFYLARVWVIKVHIIMVKPNAIHNMIKLSRPRKQLSPILSGFFLI
ncbi:hypothetical protein RF11_13771 [Thelohanellus kitauei]|uniref:Uncharacterized protein n=1 Tax=Thelohanellus kitauei TaxID=669202 RepID=A0A0C2MQP8_THEKT|nr:hypothetical protein RF11_13771 [Thelohanellus kitauei]